MTIENKEIFIPGPSGRIQAKYFKSTQLGAPVALGNTSPDPPAQNWSAVPTEVPCEKQVPIQNKNMM